MTSATQTIELPAPNGSVVGYARVSSEGQKLDIQLAELEAANVPRKLIFKEKRSGRSMEERVELRRMLDSLEPGDTVRVTRLDRLARSLSDLVRIGQLIRERGAHLHVIQQNVDTTTPAGRAMYGMLAIFAEFEADIREERQAEGIAKAKEKGVYKGRPATIPPAAILELANEGKGPTAIAEALGITRQSVYRVARENGIKIGRERDTKRQTDEHAAIV